MNKIFEKFWWSMAIIIFISLIYFTINDGFAKWSFYFVIPFLCVAMAMMRRFMIKRLESNQKPPNKKK
jgi:hypothetical protein